MKVKLIIAWFCNLIDIIFTLYFYIYHNGVELNPISAELLQSPILFGTFKLVVMTIAVMFLWWKRDWKFCRVTSWVLLIEYLLVVVYYLIINYLLLI